MLFDSQADTSSRFCHEYHDVLTFLMTRLPISWFLVKYHSEIKCFFVPQKRACLSMPRIGTCTTPSAGDFATVLHDTCRLYVLQMRRNELKYGFNCQNHACFPRIYLQFFINKALTASNSVDRQNFVGKSVTETINLTEVFNITVDSR